MKKLALDGGIPVLAKPIAGTGNRFGVEEERLVIEVLRSGNLNKKVNYWLVEKAPNKTG